MNAKDSVGTVPLVGPSYEKRLKKLEITTIDSLLHHIPFRYQDFRNTKKIADLKVGETVTLVAQVVTFRNFYTKTGKLTQNVTLSDGEDTVEAIWFNMPFLSRTIPEGTTVSLSGKLSFWNRKKAFIFPQFEKIVEGRDVIHTGRIVPIYSETAGITSKWLRSRIDYVLKHIEDIAEYDEFLPESVLSKNKLPSYREALRKIHLPKDSKEAIRSRERLAFNELLSLQIENLLKKINWQTKNKSMIIKVNKKKIESFINSLSFELTPSQKRSVKEVLNDMEKDIPMNRLLEGDVGSGKTIIAAIASYAAFLSGYQTAIMAPTQILAQQHAKNFKKLFGTRKVKISLITSSIKKSDIKKGDIFIGTHSLINKRAVFDNIGLTIIDEQHRFGVAQRAKIVDKARANGFMPHILTMTATPIPRTIALSLYGDLDLSTLDEMPAGRKKITTWVVPAKKRAACYKWIESQIKEKGDQAFVVCPIIEESEKESMKEVKAAKKEFEELKKIFPDLALDLLHGRHKGEEKEKILKKFINGKTDILVSTPIVEVGIDIPNATIMVIDGAERFGLSQIHQLRGRVGRGTKKSYCILFGKFGGQKAKARISALKEAKNGRELSEMDLSIRGPGEVFGVRQHGLGELRIASWSDISLMKKTKKLAEKIVAEPETYKKILDYFQSKIISPN